MGIQFLIVTYNRRESCQRLVDSLQGIGDIVVLNDGCDYEINGCKQVFQEVHNGRYRYFATVNNLFSLRGNSPYYIMLPDDFLMDKKQVEEALHIWRNIKDERKICLNLYADRLNKKCWTQFRPVLKGNVWLSQWVDMCFLCENRFFGELGRITADRFHGSLNKKSSGVGSYVSTHLYRKGFNLYQVTESLVTPQIDHWLNSKMYDKNNVPDCYHSVPPSKFTRICR